MAKRDIFRKWYHVFYETFDMSVYVCVCFCSFGLYLNLKTPRTVHLTTTICEHFPQECAYKHITFEQKDANRNQTNTQTLTRFTRRKDEKQNEKKRTLSTTAPNLFIGLEKQVM